MRLYLPLVPCNGIQDSLGLWIQHRGFRILGTGFRILRQWNLDSGFQSGFLKLYRGFQSPGFRIPQDKLPGFWIPQAKISRILESAIPYMGRYFSLNRPLPSSKNPHFQNEARCTTFLVKMSFISMRMKMSSISKAEHLPSF